MNTQAPPPPPRPEADRWAEIAREAADTGTLDELLTRAEFLVRADPQLLLPLLARARSTPARLAAAVWHTSAYRHTEAGPEVRRRLLAMDAARWGARQLATDLATEPAADPVAGSAAALPWRVGWATGSQVSASLRGFLGSGTDPVTAVAVSAAEQRPLAVTGHPGGAVRRWDLRTGVPLGP
ncbi:hypothetical protein ADK51_13065, partial [Streptomyces sp. WM6368]